MRDYTSFFIGIPISDKGADSFRTLIYNLNTAFPEIPTADPATPHFTLYYLTESSESELANIKTRVEDIKDLLKDVEIEIGGFDYFGKETPRILFLDVHYPDKLNSFNQLLRGSLKEYSAEDNELGFHPHVTVASVKDPEAQEVFQANREKIEDMFNEIKYSFSINEIVLYGANSEKQPELQEPLLKIDI